MIEHFGIMAKDNRAFASFNQIGFDAADNPDQEDLRRAWVGGAWVARLTPVAPLV